MAATRFENGPHVAARNLGPRQPIPQPNPGTRHPVHGPEGSGPHLTDQPHPHVHQPRPYFYVQPPPPLPLYHYQWPMPMPMSYNPYSGFPGMGYGMPGMVMPPFPPHPYMEVPGYVLPHSQLYPAEYRRYQFPPAAMAYQNNSRTSRTFYHNATPIETVNSEVQTEPPPEAAKDGPSLARPLAGSDYGRGTNSTTTSLSYNTEKQSCPEEEPNPPIASKTGFQGMLRSQGTGTAPPTGTKTIHSCKTSIEALGKTVHGGGHLVHHDVWSVCSADCMGLTCNSSDKVEKKRVSSFPDVLMGGGSPSSKMERAPKCGPTLAHEEITQENTTEGYNVIMAGSCELEGVPNIENGHNKILKLPFVRNDLMTESKLNKSVWSVAPMAPHVPSTQWMTQNGLMAPEDVAQELSEKGSDDHANQSQMSFYYSQVPKKLNESVWSVQSLAPYVPPEELLIENGIVVTEKEADPPNVSQDLAASQVIAITERRRSLRFSLTFENVKEAEKMADENTTPCQESFHYSQIQQKANESVWSVQSLVPYVPSTEWMKQNRLLDHEASTERESAANVSQGHTASQVLVITERSQKLSLSSVDTLHPYVPSSCCLANKEKGYYYSELPLGTVEHKQVFSKPMDKLIQSKRPNTLNTETLPSSKRESKRSCNLHMEPVEKVNVDGSPTRKSAVIPSVEGSLNSTQGSLKPKAQCSLNQKALEDTEHRVWSPPCSPDDPETYASKCLTGDKAPGYCCPGRCNQEMEAKEKESAKQTGPMVPSQQDCEQIADVRMLTAPSSNGHFKTCGLKCSMLQERNCSCEAPKTNGVSFRKRPTGRLNEAKMTTDLIMPQAQERLVPQNQKRQMDSRRANKAMPDHVPCDNGYGLNNSKKRRRWQNRPQDRPQTNPSNNPLGQRKAQRNGDEEQWNGDYGRSGKTRGANGRNLRY